jgi:hypothetical protein
MWESGSLATSRNSPTETVREITTDNQHECAVLYSRVTDTLDNPSFPRNFADIFTFSRASPHFFKNV